VVLDFDLLEEEAKNGARLPVRLPWRGGMSMEDTVRDTSVAEGVWGPGLVGPPFADRRS